MLYEGKNCLTCGAFLGGGACRNNLESECREGGGFEGWIPRRSFVFRDEAQQYVKAIGWKHGYEIRRKMGHYELTLEGWKYEI